MRRSRVALGTVVVLVVHLLAYDLGVPNVVKRIYGESRQLCRS